ncbi:isopenicillin N synthase family oxygenase [Modestobacter sp. VKM Ac-2986]|uniref:isopenicillin N synthase family dioxygenase n=1 Tax=Modestobacter sp. VKM Ac-2986 TaxID=3004140 RepID=UPI0022AAF396|nr:2-oxoglutarate and iron-dependent oxygenase domain-containing protein [Modestobacter sp. VKM Ac-2986]MCZ2828715.1 isopenicillin N synthase family oxygenase [Modestobacter sp. VKM Ac-2986]
MTAVPLVDLTPWYSGDPEGRRQVATDVDRALCEVGVLLVTGHPLSPPLTHCLREEARLFFAEPPAAKAELATLPGGRGWVPPGGGATADLVESFGFGSEEAPAGVLGTLEAEWFEPNVWPAGTPCLRASATAFTRCGTAVAEELLRVLALALDLDADFFTSRFAAGAWHADLTWYPARRTVGSVAPGQMRVAAHTDPGTLTLTDREPGLGCLQVQTLEGAWVDVPCVPGALTVTAGDLLARWTGDRWRSAPHRVLPPPVEAPAEELLSLAFCAEPDPRAVVERLPTAAAGPTRHDPVTAGQYRRERAGSLPVG